MEKISREFCEPASSEHPQDAAPTARSLRTAKRCNQILDAAAIVFQRHGFHQSTMAEVATKADMSVGHIYRYFENKEAVIAAISERDLQRSRETMEAMVQDPAGLSAAMLAGVDEGVSKMMDRAGAALFLEVMAEAARNPKVADCVRSQNDALLACMGALFAGGRTTEGRYSTAQAVDLMSLVFNGLRIRAIQDPAADRVALAESIRTFVSDLIGETETQTALKHRASPPICK